MPRSSALAVLAADYVRTARAKGLAGVQVHLRHVARNAINPLVWPGIGQMMVDAILTDVVKAMRDPRIRRS